MSTNIIVAISNNYCIGNNNKLLFKNKEDMNFFVKKTTNNIIIMGRKTFESIGSKPLPNRINIVLSKNPEYINSFYINKTSHNLKCVTSLTNAISLSQTYYPEKEIFIIGGGEIYKQALENNLVDFVYCNKFFEAKDGDTFFPKLDKTIWNKMYDIVSPDKFFEYKMFVNMKRVDTNYLDEVSIISNLDKIICKDNSDKVIHFENENNKLSKQLEKLYFIQQNLCQQDFIDLGFDNPQHKWNLFTRNNHNLLLLANSTLKGKELENLLSYINSR